MKILVYRWKSYTYQDTIDVLKEMGHQVDEIYQKLMDYDVDEAFAEILRDKIVRNGYDIVFTSNYFGMISDVCQDLGLIYVAWSCDNPLISMYHRSVFNDCNRIFLFDLSSVMEFKEMGVENIWHLPLCVNSKRLDKVISTDANRFAGDVAMVGSLYERNSYDKLKYSMPEYLCGYFEAMMRVQKDMFGVNIMDEMFNPSILEQIESFYELKSSKDSMSNLELIFSTTVLGFKIARMARISSLNALAKCCNVNLYTGSDTSMLEGVNVRPEVDYWNEMPLVFNHSKININITIPNIRTGVPLRCFDVLGSGGFLLSNYQGELPMLFEEGKELALYYDEADLVDKCSYYLSHDLERRNIAENGKKRVQADYSYEKQLNFIFSHI